MRLAQYNQGLIRYNKLSISNTCTSIDSRFYGRRAGLNDVLRGSGADFDSVLCFLT